MKGMQWVENLSWAVWKVLPTTALLWALLLPQQWFAQNVSGIDEGVLSTEVTAPKVKEKKWATIDWETAIQWTSVKDDDKWISVSDKDEKKPWITGWGDGDDSDKDQGNLPEDWTDQTKEKSESWTSLSRQSGVWYSITGWEALWVNRFIWSGKLFKGKLWEISVTWIADLDNPLHTNWSWKLILLKQLYKGFSLDWDYTFTWAWNNIFRFGMWYGGKLWDGSYGVKIFPLNTNGSPISAKVTFGSKVWKNWFISSFVFVDFDTNWYYSETEYVHQLAQWVAAFVQARLMWTIDGKFTGTDAQTLMWWVKITL